MSRLDAQRLVQLLAQLSREATGDVSAETLLTRLCALAGEAVAVDGAGVMITRDGANRFVHASSAAVQPLESLQAMMQVGPCAAAVETALPVMIADLTVSDQWPAFCELATQIGVHSVLAIPLVAQGRTWGVLDLYRMTPGGWSEAEFQAAVVLADVAATYVVMAADREVARQASAQLAHQATHDPLTGLPNRVLLYERLEAAMVLARRRREAVAVVFIDLDRFKSINDNFGHIGGDMVLKEVATRLASTLRAHDTLGRLAGDEFVWIAGGLTAADPARLTHDVETITSRIRRVLDNNLSLAGAQVSTTASLGVIISLGETTAQEVLAEADMAMYAAKRRGRGSVVIRDHTKTDGLSYARQLERDLAQVIADEELVVYYQPIVSAHHPDRAVAVEALLRWQHPDGPVLPAAAFIDLAISTGLIGAFGRWLIKQTCAQMRAWIDQFGAAAPTVAYVNLSARELADTSLPRTIAEALKAFDLKPPQLGIEIVEQDLADPAIALRLSRFRDRGHLLSVDDFGTGYSSLSRLIDLSVDVVKIDRSLITGIPEDTKRVAVIDAIMTIASKLDLKVVAEGIETPEQLKHLTDTGCHLLQGYLLGRPAPAHEIAASFAQRGKAPRRGHVEPPMTSTVHTRAPVSSDNLLPAAIADPAANPPPR